MNSLLRDDRQVVPVSVHDLDAVIEIETAAYAFPWSRRNFFDSIAAGYWLQALRTADDWLGYCVAMAAVDELHLLNLTIAPAHQGRGHGAFLLDALCARARSFGCTQLWLEVRPSNAPALSLYERHGFRTIGTRRGYYPAEGGRREDATVMSLALDAPARRPHAVD